MKHSNLFKVLGVSLLLSVASLALKGQEQYRLVNDQYSLKIEGTSNLHDWTMEAEDISGDVTAEMKSSVLESFKNATIRVPVEKLESGKRIMNNKTYDALKSDDHPHIEFQLKSVEDMYAAGSRFSGTARGNLTIAGKSRMVSIPFSGKINGNNQFKVSGDYSLNMTSYDVDPPKAMFGSLTTGDKVTIQYEFVFEQASDMYTNRK